MDKPFAILEEWVRQGRIHLSQPTIAENEPRDFVIEPLPGGLSDEKLFELAMKDVKSLGWSAEELTPPGSDRIFDAVVAWGDEQTIAGKLRGHFHDYLGVKVMPTFHPAYLLRDPHKKREVWEDMKMVRDYLKG